MGADPALAPLLVGLGLRELSVDPRAIGAVAESLRRVSVAGALELAREAMALPTAGDVARAIARVRADGAD
jgi:phosphotransferase system enzyme I (PtsI)